MPLYSYGDSLPITLSPNTHSARVSISWNLAPFLGYFCKAYHILLLFSFFLKECERRKMLVHIVQTCDQDFNRMKDPSGRLCVCVARAGVYKLKTQADKANNRKVLWSFKSGGDKQKILRKSCTFPQISHKSRL